LLQRAPKEWETKGASTITLKGREDLQASCLQETSQY
jgi:hypothetical protein